MNAGEVIVLALIVLAAVGVVALRDRPQKKRIDWPKRPGCGG